MTRPKRSNKSVLILEPQARGHTVTHYGAMLESPAWRERTAEGDACVSIVCPRGIADGLRERIGNESMLTVFKTEFGPDSPKWTRAQTMAALIKAVRLRKYDRVLLMYLDDLLPLVPFIRLLLPGVKLAGLYMRPMAHFKAYGYPTTGKVKSRWIVAWCKNMLLLSFMKTGLLQSCILQDEGAVSYFDSKAGKALWMPTPVSHAGELLRTDSAFHRFTLFGEISERKGIFRICDAWKKLPAAFKDKVELRLIGQPLSGEEPSIRAAVERLSSNGWRILSDFRFVRHEEIPGIHAETDVLLLPYRNHLGTSGVLVQALYWDIPVIVDDFGWPAFTLSKLKGGAVVDTSDAALFAKAVASMLNQREVAYGFREYIENNYSRDRFGNELTDIIFLR